jgi:hypothetical protein
LKTIAKNVRKDFGGNPIWKGILKSTTCRIPNPLFKFRMARNMEVVLA